MNDAYENPEIIYSEDASSDYDSDNSDDDSFYVDNPLVKTDYKQAFINSYTSEPGKIVIVDKEQGKKFLSWQLGVTMLECLGYHNDFYHGEIQNYNTMANIVKKAKEVLEKITNPELKRILTELLVENKPIDKVSFQEKAPIKKSTDNK